MKKIIQHLLYNLAKKILKKYQPDVIGITGSVGKTSTKEAVYEVLKNKLSVRTNPKNYNTEFGVPLTIINARSGGKNIFKWLFVFFQAFKLIFLTDKKYPKILILEMAADHPGDISYLVSLAKPKIAIVTAVGPAHLEFFETLDNIIREKQNLISNLDKKDYAILNADDNLVLAMQKKTVAKVLTYGLNETADYRVVNINYSPTGPGLTCEIVTPQNNQQQAEFSNVLALNQIDSFLSAITVGQIYGINMEEILNSLKDFKFPAGRLQIISGIKKTTLIDDTYNSSPKAVKVALEVLSRLNCSSRRLAVLGDMLELGGFSQTAHEEVGEWVKEYKVDILITVGEKSKHTARVAEINGLAKEKVVAFDNYYDAGKFIQSEISEGDLILIKGSQGMRMENIVKEIMAEPLRAKDLLVRQSKDWLKK